MEEDNIGPYERWVEVMLDESPAVLATPNNNVHRLADAVVRYGGLAAGSLAVPLALLQEARTRDMTEYRLRAIEQMAATERALAAMMTPIVIGIDLGEDPTREVHAGLSGLFRHRSPRITDPRPVQHAAPGKKRSAKDELAARNHQRTLARDAALQALIDKAMRNRAAAGKWTPHKKRALDL